MIFAGGIHTRYHEPHILLGSRVSFYSCHARLFCLGLTPGYVGMSDETKARVPPVYTQSTETKAAILVFREKTKMSKRTWGRWRSVWAVVCTYACTCMCICLCVWPVVWLAGWLAGWLAFFLAGLRAVSLDGRSTGCLVGGPFVWRPLCCRLGGLLAGWPAHRLACFGMLAGWLAYLLAGQLAGKQARGRACRFMCMRACA